MGMALELAEVQVLVPGQVEVVPAVKALVPVQQRVRVWMMDTMVEWLVFSWVP